MAQSLATILFFAVLLAAGGGWFLWSAVTSPYKGYAEPKKLVEVRKGLRTAAIVRHLQSHGIVRDQYIPLIYMKLVRYKDSVKAGVYEFSKPVSAAEAVVREDGNIWG